MSVGGLLRRCSQQGPVLGTEVLAATVLGGGYVGISLLEEVSISHTREPADSRAGLPRAEQLTERAHSPSRLQTIRFKSYRAWPCPPEQDLLSPKASPFRQEASYPHPPEGRQKKQEL